jgi:hypothetical protein
VLDGLDNVDWDSLQAPEVRRWLKAAASKKHEGPRLTAIAALQNYLVPWELMEGYACPEHWDQLQKLMAHDIPSVAVPFLIEILKTATTPRDKIALSEILYDLCRYVTMPHNRSTEFDENLRVWGAHLQQLVRTGVELYRTLLFDEEPDVRTMANDLLGILGDDNFIPAWSPWRE